MDANTPTVTRPVDVERTWDTLLMRERATLRLANGEELGVEVDRDDLNRDEILVRRTSNDAVEPNGLLAVIDEHLATAAPHPAGTTDRLLEADRLRPY
jgi:hypothetical protein